MQQQLPPADSLRAVLRDVLQSPDFAWQERRHPLQPLMDFARRLIEWFGRLSEEHPVAYWSLLAAMTLLLAAMIVHMAWVVRQALRGRGPVTMPAEAVVLRRDARWHMARAAEMARAGEYGEALAHRFTALLLDLQQRGVLRYHPSKTAAEYVSEASLDAPSRSAFQQLVDRLYRHSFAAEPCAEDDYRLFDHNATALKAAHAPR